MVIIGEAPGEKENERGKPFIGPSGKLLREMLTKVGLDMEEFFICNTVCCWPRSGAPKERHIDACLPNLRDQLVLAQARHILVLGAVALSVFRNKDEASILRDHGMVWGFTDDELTITFLATYHPAYVLRNRAVTKAWRLDLEEFARMVNDE